MTQNEIKIVEELEQAIIKPGKSGIGEFIQKISTILGVLGKGKLLEFVSTKLVELIKEVRDVLDVVKDLKADIEELKKSGK